MGIFKRKRSETGTASAPQRTAGGMPLLDGALDTLAQVVRTFGRDAFKLENDPNEPLADRCEEWARHVLTGTTAGNEDGDAGTTAGAQRDWAGLRRFIALRRASEATYVERWRKESKQMIWDLVTAMNTVAGCGHQTEDSIAEKLQRLQSAAQEDSLSSLRNAVVETVDVIRTTMQAQREQLDGELAAMGKRLSAMREELLDARREMSIDALTQVYNRRAFDEALQQHVTLSAFSGQKLALMMVDIDHFKKVNDTRGHSAGDEILKEFASRLVRVFPRRNDFVARFGGEEFAVILPDLDAAGTRPLTTRLLAAVSERRYVDSPPLYVTCSVGYAFLRQGEQPARLIERADQALYEAKRTGRNRAVSAEAMNGAPAPRVPGAADSAGVQSSRGKMDPLTPGTEGQNA